MYLRRHRKTKTLHLGLLQFTVFVFPLSQDTLLTSYSFLPTSSHLYSLSLLLHFIPLLHRNSFRSRQSPRDQVPLSLVSEPYDLVLPGLVSAEQLSYRSLTSSPLPKSGQRFSDRYSAHILHDVTLNSSEEQCGLCLHPAPMCSIYLKKSRGVSGSCLVDQTASTCPNLVRFNYKSAARSSDSSPCSNVPISCSICPPDSSAVWVYSLHAHYHKCHRIKSPALFPTHVEQSQSEKDGMKRVWDTCFKKRKSYFKKKKSKPLAISEAHQSRFLIQ